jgi:hypothetical protein
MIPEEVPEWVTTVRDGRHWTVVRYRERGFTVIEEPLSDDLPTELQEFHVDVLAKSVDANYAIVIRRPSDISENNLALARKVKELPGWHFSMLYLGEPLPKSEKYKTSGAPQAVAI